MMPSRDDIFLDAREINCSAQRLAFIAEACGQDVGLRDEVEAMLREAEKGDAFFAADETRITAKHSFHGSIGMVIGRYKLVEKIGEGGMGVVYLAEQREPIVRKVALKIIKAGMDTAHVIARFESERQALALMDHPNIAKVLDGGETENGRPYFVMDLIRGFPITHFCDEAKLSTHERMELFLEVCSAIQHAHLKGIIHRDIKPSNVLVTLHGDKPAPKVIDFGIAKATHQPLTDKTLFTQFQHFIGTPSYMSPEQTRLTGLDIDTRTDIYSLGVLLFELLTGTTPLDEKELLKSGFDEMRRTIREKEPLRPSTRLISLGKEAVSMAAECRRTNSSELLHVLRGDLDWIVMKSLEKDRDRRYETVNALASDISHFFKNEPIMARAPSVAYRFKKIVQRNKLAFSACATILAVLIVAVVVSSWQAIRANRERARAEARLASTLKFVECMFTNVSLELQKLVGGASANAALNTNSFLLMEELRRDTDGNPQFDLALGKIYMQIGMANSSIGGNSSGNPDLSLNAATQAIRLFVQLGPDISRDQRAHRIARAELVAGFAETQLRHHEKALVHFREMDKWARLLTESTNSYLVEEGVRMQRWAVGCIGDALSALGQSERALRDNYLPFMRELQNRKVSDQSKNWTDLHDLAAVSSSLGRVYDSLGQSANASLYLRQAHHVLGIMRNLFPNDAQIAAEFPLAEAELGRFLLAQGLEEGLDHLESAANDIQRLVRGDPANVSFAESQITIARLRALGMAKWSGDASAPAFERQERASNAQLHLDEAEAFLASLPSESLRNTLRAQIEEARKEVSAAKNKTAQPDSASSQNPKRQ